MTEIQVSVHTINQKETMFEEIINKVTNLMTILIYTSKMLNKPQVG